MTVPPRALLCSRERTWRAGVRGEFEAFEVAESPDGDTAAALVRAWRPDVVVVDATDPGYAARAIDRMRENLANVFTPVVFVVADLAGVEAIAGAVSAWDDYVVHPQTSGEVALRAEVAVRRPAAVRAINPLTGLPSNPVVESEIERRLATSTPFACLYVDLDGFKAYNDRRGFVHGDEVIRRLARCIVDACRAEGPSSCFAGHVGGDDFVVIAPPELAEGVAARIAASFPSRRDFGGGADPCSVSVGVVYCAAEGTPGEVAERAAGVKTLAKARSGSSWAVEPGVDAAQG